MRRLTPLLTVLTTATAMVTLGFTAAGASAAVSAGHDGSGPVARPLPYQVFAPYYETYDTSGGLAAQSRQSGAKFLSLAFLETAAAGSCTAYWNGDTTEPIAAPAFGADIAAIQRRGGNVIPSFGGYTADTTGTDIADSCTSVPAIAQVFESLITTYHVPRIDLDVEADSLTNAAGINRRNEAIAMTEAWAAAHHQRIQFSYTLPTFPAGLTAPGLAVLQNAVADGARISDREPADFRLLHRHPAGHGGRHRDGGGRPRTPSCSRCTRRRARAQLWHMIGVTEMPGIDDYGPDETFSTADAVTVLQLGAAAGHRAGVVLGAAARQRRLSGYEGRGHLLGRGPAGVVLQPRVRALHQVRQVGRSRVRRPATAHPAHEVPARTRSGARPCGQARLRRPPGGDAGRACTRAVAARGPVARVGDGVGAGSGVGVSGRAGLGAGVWTAG